MNLYMLPLDMNLGIGQVVGAYKRHLPKFGFQFVDDPNEADLVVLHAGETTSRLPDVAHNHGLYPTASVLTDDMFFGYNARVIDNLRKANLVTVPSNWVADQVRRNMLFNPHILPHGIELDEWGLPDKPGDYILWAKGHMDKVCDPKSMNEVAAMLPQHRFVTTFGMETDNVTVVGQQSFDKMREWIRGAGLYLATTKETFGIQTLEAMACGVPVVGWSWGCTPDIVNDDVGMLSRPRDIEALAANIDWMMAHRDEYTSSCLERVKAYSWEHVIGNILVPLYRTKKAHDFMYDVSVVITCHNYERYVAGAIQSVLGQDFNGDIEIIVVDDASSDDSIMEISKFGDDVTLLSVENNVGPAMARNIGISRASATIIASLDADDEMLPYHLSTLVPLVKNRGVGIAYGKLIVDTGRSKTVGEWPGAFNFKAQANGRNCIPSASVFLKEAWKRVGGYSSQYIRGEDAEFWLRIASIGYGVARADVPVYVYRMHPENLTSTQEEPDWVGGKPWSGDESLVPFAASTTGYSRASHPVHEYDEPWASVIIPVGPGHETIAWRAVDSVFKQSLPYWECIVVNDSGKDLTVPSTGELLQDTFPFIKVIVCDARNVSVARNMGAVEASSGLLVFLDADDAIYRDYLKYTVQAYNENPDNYVYTDWMNAKGESHESVEFNCEQLRREAIHPVTALVPKAWHIEVGGFDEEIDGWEDWEYYLKLSANNHCGIRVPEPLVIYDYESGVRREFSLTIKKGLLKILKNRYRRDKMACNSPGCGKRSNRRGNSRVPRTASGRASVAPSKGVTDEMVLVEYMSGTRSRQAVRGVRTRANYGRKSGGDKFMIHRADQAAQPHVYPLVSQQAVQHMDTTPVDRPVAPPVPPQPAMPVVRVQEVKPVEVVKDVVIPDIVYEEVPDEEFEVDIETMPLSAIKRLELDPETALIALEVEQDGRNRRNVTDYLAKTAITAMEAAAEHDHEYA